MEITCPTCGNLTKQEHSLRIKAGLKKVSDSGKRIGRPKDFFNIDKVLRLQRMGYSYRGMAKRIGISQTTIHRKTQEYYLERAIKTINHET
jgi:DNA invertase Pin-like site-specific DNA recombinase